VEKMVENIKAEMKQTPYTCAIGVAYADVQRSFKTICTIADEAMYADKVAGKKQAENK